MNVLICGKQNGLCRLLADRLNREKHEIYYLSGNSDEGKLTKTVFQEYHFPYLHENINQIFASAKPDIVIVTGAHDDNFTWANAEHESTKFVTSMTSLFMAAQNEGVKKLIYLSSTEVFENNYEEVINSSVEPSADDSRLNAFIKTEKLLSGLKTQDENEKAMEVATLRLPVIFGDQHSNSQHDVCLRLTLNYIKNGKVPIIPELTHSAIYLRDAAEAVMCCIRYEQNQTNRVFQARGLVFSEEELGNALIETQWRKDATLEIEESYNNSYTRSGYPPARIDDTDEFVLGFGLKYDLKRAIDLLCKECMRINTETYKKKKKKVQLLPFFEAIFFGILTYFMTSFLLGTWVGDALNLFAIYVLVFAVSYGLSYGLLTSIFAGIGLLLIMTQDASFVDVISNYVYYLQFWQLILTGVIAGFVRDKYQRKNRQLTEENKYQEAEIKDLTLINDNNAYVKGIFEKRLIGYSNSLSRIYELTTELDFYESQKVIFQAVRMVTSLMEMKDVSVYTLNSSVEYLRLAAATSPLAASCGRTIKIDEQVFFYENLKNQTIYMNRECLDNRPTFCGGVYSDHKPIAIICVWTDDLRQVNLYTSNMLAIACRLIEKSVSRALLYEKTLRYDIYERNSNIMNQNAFLKMVNIYEDGYKQGLLFYTLMKVDRKGHGNEEATHLIRGNDIIGIVNGEMYMVLPYATATDSKIVSERFAKKGMEATPIAKQALLSMEQKPMPVSENPELSFDKAYQGEMIKNPEKSSEHKAVIENEILGALEKETLL